MEFLYSRNRLNVATSRARCLAVVVAIAGRSFTSRAGRPTRCGSPTRSAGSSRSPPSRNRTTTGAMRARRAAPLTLESCASASARPGPPYHPRQCPTALLCPHALARPAPAHDLDARRRSGDRQHRSHRGRHGRHDRRRELRRRLGRLAGLPAASVVLGSALGSALLSILMARRGRRAGLSLGYAVSVVGAFVATGAVVIAGRCRPWSSARCSSGSATAPTSYRATPPPTSCRRDRRASTLGLVVWGATVGAVVGPILVAFSGEVAMNLGLPVLAGAVPRADGVRRRGGGAVLRDAPARPVRARRHHGRGTTRRRRDGRHLARGAPSTPGRPRGDHGAGLRPGGHGPDHDDDPAAHDPARPWPRGRRVRDQRPHLRDVRAVADLGTPHRPLRQPVSSSRRASAVLAISSVLAAVAPPEGGALLFIALFLLGYGWNMGFVAGSALLTHGLAIPERTRLQGFTDAFIWSSAAAASLSSGLVVDWAGYATLGLIGAGLIAIPAIVLLGTRASRALPAPDRLAAALARGPTLSRDDRTAIQIRITPPRNSGETSSRAATRTSARSAASSVACRTSLAACCAQRPSPGPRHRSCGRSASARRTRTRRCAPRASTSWRSTTAAPRSSAASCSPTCAGPRPSRSGMSPTEFRGLLDRFYALATALVIDHDGSIDKFVGDELVAMYFPLLSGERARGASRRDRPRPFPRQRDTRMRAVPGCRSGPACTRGRPGSAPSATARAPT